MNRKLFWRVSNAWGIGNRLTVWPRVRGGGRHIIGPVYISVKVEDTNKYLDIPSYTPPKRRVRDLDITVSDRMVHRWWAFHASLHLNK